MTKEIPVQDKKENFVDVREALYAGRKVFRYTVTSSDTGREIASGWCETEELARHMAEKIADEKTE